MKPNPKQLDGRSYSSRINFAKGVVLAALRGLSAIKTKLESHLTKSDLKQTKELFVLLGYTISTLERIYNNWDEQFWPHKR